MKLRFIGPAFGVLLFLNLPSLALWEETFFRSGITTTAELLAGAYVFGLAHCIAGIPIAWGLAVAIAGVAFGIQYTSGGIPASTAHHIAYNVLAITMLFLGLIRSGKERPVA